MPRTAAAAEETTPTIDYLFDEPQLDAVSFSRMDVFEQCPYRALLQFKRKIKEQRLPMDGETPLDRGKRIHKEAELYILGRAAMTEDMRFFSDDFETMRSIHKQSPKRIQVEQMWCFDRNWRPLPDDDFVNTWMRVKQDIVVQIDTERVLCVDLKSGRADGNEVKHNTQLRVASLGAMFKHPDAEEFIIENWYLDKDKHVQIKYTRSQIVGMFGELNTRLMKVTDCTNFKPTPSKESCKWCPYKSGRVGKYVQGTGDCTYAYKS